jgi:hypothetical protein
MKQELEIEIAIARLRQQLTYKQRDLILSQAETERLAALSRQDAERDKVNCQADIFEREAPRRDFQRDEEERRRAHEEALARFEALGKMGAILADHHYLATSSATYAYPGYTDGRDHPLTKVLDRLIEPTTAAVSAGSNGHATPETKQ